MGADRRAAEAPQLAEVRPAGVPERTVRDEAEHLVVARGQLQLEAGLLQVADQCTARGQLARHQRIGAQVREAGGDPLVQGVNRQARLPLLLNARLHGDHTGLSDPQRTHQVQVARVDLQSGCEGGSGGGCDRDLGGAPLVPAQVSRRPSYRIQFGEDSAGRRQGLQLRQSVGPRAQVERVVLKGGQRPGDAPLDTSTKSEGSCETAVEGQGTAAQRVSL
ncbi:hypothetical protein V1460_21430 [Streptomyces sp. SCSIO 30461]|uniref:hypothetical protein n=1 Tax=Streptomyces sp. SCSIO 30461 TaxID=3118085 RepID=UPI0030CA827C